MSAGPTILSVTLDEAIALLRAADGSEVGTLAERPAKILHALAEIESLNIQLYGQFRCEQARCGRKNRKAAEKELQSLLCIIIYGPFHLFEAVGDFVSQCEMYLQDPLHCDRDVPYRNPHLLSGLDEEPPMTSSFIHHRVSLAVEKASTRPDLFALLRSEDPLPESLAPPALATTLYGYDLHDQALHPWYD